MQTSVSARIDRSVGRSLGTDLATAVAVGLVVALARKYLGFHIGVPGHAGVGWIAALFAGVSLNPRRGMATVAGVSAGLWGMPVGIDHGAVFNIVMLGSAGAVLDAMRAVRFPTHFLAGAALAGAAVHVAKFTFVFGNALLSGMMRDVEAYGFTASLRNHVLFGMIGGLLGWVAMRGFRFATVAWTNRESGIGAHGNEPHHQD